MRRGKFLHLTKLTNRLVSACLLLSLSTQVIAQEPAPNLRSSTLRLIDKLDHESTAYFYARKDVARWFSEGRKYEQALEQMTGLPISERIELITIIAMSAVDAREKVAAEKILSNAFSLLANCADDEAFFAEASYLAELALRNDNLELASRFVAILDEGSSKKSRALLKLARARADLNDRKETTALVEAALAQTSGFDAAENDEVIGIKVEAARVLASVGELDRAKHLAASANVDLSSQAAPDSLVITAVADTFGALGNLTQAIGMVESLEVDRRVSAFASLSVLCKDKELSRSLQDRALDVILSDTHEGAYVQSMRLSGLISAFLKTARVDEAFEILHKIEDSYYLHTSAIEVAKALRQRERIADAEAALDIARKTAEKLVSEKSGDIPPSASFSVVGGKSRILSTLVNSYVSIGSLPRAELAARAIDHPQFKASALGRIAVAYAIKKDRIRAQSLLDSAFSISSKAEEYSHDQSREDGLFNVIRAMSEGGFSREAKNATALFLQTITKNRSFDQYAGYLFILGDLAETNGISLSKKSEALLSQIESQ